MGPTNVALVKLFQADNNLRETQLRLEAVSRNVRIQQRKVSEVTMVLSMSAISRSLRRAEPSAVVIASIARPPSAACTCNESGSVEHATSTASSGESTRQASLPTTSATDSRTARSRTV